jgi:small conductance mechanosensitive channel
MITLNVVTDLLEKLIAWSLTHGIRVVLILLAAYLIKVFSKRLINKIAQLTLKSDLADSEGEIKRLNTIVRIITWTVNTLLIIVITLMLLKEFSVDITPLLAGAGILGVAVGFGGQYLVRDIISGFFIIFENQYRIGDSIKIAGISGTVEDINLRVTILRDMDGTLHYIPHGEIKTVSNMSKHFGRVNLNVGVSYNADINQVKEVINQVGQEITADPAWKDLILETPSFLRIDSLDESSISIKIVGKVKPSRQWEVTGELRKRLKEAFDKAGIEIPYPQQVIHLSKE